MCTNDASVSLYLKRPRRRYEQFLRKEAERARGPDRIGAPTGTSTRITRRKDANDVKPRS